MIQPTREKISPGERPCDRVEQTLFKSRDLEIANQRGGSAGNRGVLRHGLDRVHESGDAQPLCGNRLADPQFHDTSSIIRLIVCEWDKDLRPAGSERLRGGSNTTLMNVRSRMREQF